MTHTARVVGLRNAKPMTDEQAELFDRHRYVVGLLLKRFRLKLRARGVEYDDARQVAMCGLWRAASNNDPSIKASFFSLAYRCVMVSLYELAEVHRRDKERLNITAFSNTNDEFYEFIVDRADTPSEPAWIDDVDPKYAAMIRRRLAGASWDDVAKEFGYGHRDSARWSVKAAYNKLMRASERRECRNDVPKEIQAVQQLQEAEATGRPVVS